ncbi:MAG TPA: FAD-binding oxidoreductase [Candidatus Saccharibacteria bacterium]|nr:FAD-binding oxidoreductase [Candidatus Saccharibacteria bacterium]HRK93863.1 FAD-binding oxidoreductase [Candidatus Saccharibacteria bacterium]
MDLKAKLAAQFKGELDTDKVTLETYSHDASLFELKPQIVGYPKDAGDLKYVVKFVNQHKKEHPGLSITPRSRGTDMSGGAIGDSIVLDVSKHMTKLLEVSSKQATVQPGMMYKDFEVETLKKGSLLPSYPASRDMASVGGMMSNNSGGEKSLEYGKTDNFVTELKMILSDGNEYIVKPLAKAELDKKMAQKDFEGKLYKQTYELLESHYDEIQAAKPNVSKDSTGYHLWNVWNRDTGIFDLTKLFVGAQGTLGLISEGTVKLVPHREHSGLLVLFLRDIDDLGELIPAVLKHKPATFESFDDKTLWLSIKFMPSFLKLLGPARFIRLLINLIPDGLQLLRGIPKLILMVEFDGHTEDEVRQKIRALHKELSDSKQVKTRHARYEINGFEETPTEGKSEKFWIMRRYSFQLLRSKVKDKHTAPFIDDFVVPPAHLADFLPKLRRIIKKYKLFATLAGHMGDGNFHVIPLMKIEDPKERAKLEPCMKEVNNLVLKYGGSVSGEHNDGMVRGPWLREMYGEKVLGYMKDIKAIYDPQNIFNPHKKTDATWEFSFSHIRDKF